MKLQILERICGAMRMVGFLGERRELDYTKVQKARKQRADGFI